MNYFAQIGERYVIKLIGSEILLHAFICISAIGMLIAAPFAVIDLVDDVRLTDKLMTGAQIITVPLVNRKDERGDSQSGKYLYYLGLPDSSLATPYLRADPVAGLDSLQIYSHPDLIGPSVDARRLIEVPTDRSWNSVFQVVRGHSIVSAILILSFLFVVWLVITYVAIKGYFFIKNGPKKRYR